MQPTIDVTTATIEALRPQFSGKQCTVESFISTDRHHTYLLRIDCQLYRITRDTVDRLLAQNALPTNVAVAIIDFVLKHDVYNAAHSGNDSDMLWL